MDPNQGTYLIQGVQINKYLCAIGCNGEQGSILSSDTLYRSYEISIEMIDFREDTLRFRHLEGTEVDVMGIPYQGHTSNPDCYMNEEDCSYSKLTGNQLEFDILSPFAWYYGTGTLHNGNLKLETTFYYRGIEVDFYFTGYKINDRL